MLTLIWLRMQRYFSNRRKKRWLEEYSALLNQIETLKIKREIAWEAMGRREYGSQALFQQLDSQLAAARHIEEAQLEKLRL